MVAKMVVVLVSAEWYANGGDPTLEHDDSEVLE